MVLRRTRSVVMLIALCVGGFAPSFAQKPAESAAGPDIVDDDLFEDDLLDDAPLGDESLDEDLFGDDLSGEDEGSQPADPERAEELPIAVSDEEEGALPSASEASSDVADEVGPGAPTRGVEEILITASGREERIQEVPISAMAFSEVELKEARITDIAGLADYTPNLEIKTGASTVANPTIFIRGIGLLDFNSNASSSVAIFNDDVYQNSPLGQLFQFYDLENVEVLRGPQGSLYGRNATAGAIRVTPRRPDGDFSASFTGTYGDFNRREIEAAVGFPIAADVLSARIAGRFGKREGYTKNRCGNSPNAGNCIRLATNATAFGPVPPGRADWVNDEDSWAARLMLRLQPPDVETDWVLNVNGGQSRGLAYQFQSRGSTIGPTALDGIGRDGLGYRDPDRDAFSGDYDLVDPERLDLFATTLNGMTQLGDWSVKSVTGYSRAELDTARNFDASPNQFAHVIPHNEVWQVAQDLRLISDFGDDFEFDLGGFFLYETLETQQDLLEGVIFTTQRQEFEQKTLTWALFARGSYHVTDSLRLDGGVRYNWERKQFQLDVRAQPSVQQPNVNPPDPDFEFQDETWDELTGEVVLTWLASDDISVYAKYTHGFKGGHFNGGAFFSAQLIEAVEPETIDAFEIGLKSQLFDGLVTINAAAWYYDYDNYQVFALENTEGALPLAQLLNAPRVESRGIELDILAEPVEGLNLNVSLAVLDAEFSEFTVQREFVPQNCIPPQNPCPPQPETLDFTGNPLVASPPISVSVIASYEIDLGSFGVLTPRVDAIYRDKTYFTPGDQSDRGLGTNEGASQDPYWVMNARIGYRPIGERFELSFWVRNLTDETYLANALDVQQGLGKYLDIHGPPRMLGVTLGVAW